MMKKSIRRFKYAYDFLSNFYMVPVEFEGILYPSSEHAYQAAKTDDEGTKRFIAGLLKPEQAKSHGKRIKAIPDWNARRIEVMEKVLRAKFSQNPHLAMLLRKTGDAELVEGNFWRDRFWGVYRGEGENNLGKLLMKLRSEMIVSQTTLFGDP